MGKAISIKSETEQKQANHPRKNKPSNGNRREIKLKAEMKRFRQQISRMSNEIYRRTQKRKTTAKEKELLNELKKLIGGVDPTTRMFKRRIMDNANFERDQKIFFKKVGGTQHVDQMLAIEKFGRPNDGDGEIC